MNQEQKAQELIDKYYKMFEDDEDEHYIGMINRISIKCALQEVNGIIIAIQSFRQIENSSIGIVYWQTVESHLKNKICL